MSASCTYTYTYTVHVHKKYNNGNALNFSRYVCTVSTLAFSSGTIQLPAHWHVCENMIINNHRSQRHQCRCHQLDNILIICMYIAELEKITTGNILTILLVLSTLSSLLLMWWHTRQYISLHKLREAVWLDDKESKYVWCCSIRWNSG